MRVGHRQLSILKYPPTSYLVGGFSLPVKNASMMFNLACTYGSNLTNAFFELANIFVYILFDFMNIYSMNIIKMI